MSEKTPERVARVLAALGGDNLPYHTFGRFRLRRRWVRADKVPPPSRPAQAEAFAPPPGPSRRASWLEPAVMAGPPPPPAPPPPAIVPPVAKAPPVVAVAPFPSSWRRPLHRRPLHRHPSPRRHPACRRAGAGAGRASRAGLPDADGRRARRGRGHDCAGGAGTAAAQAGGTGDPRGQAERLSDGLGLARAARARPGGAPRQRQGSFPAHLIATPSRRRVRIAIQRYVAPRWRRRLNGASRFGHRRRGTAAR